MRTSFLYLFLLLVFCVITAAKSAEKLYVVQWGDESLAEIDLITGSISAHAATLGYGCNDICVNGMRIYVTNSLINTMQEIDAQSNHTLRDIPMTGGINPYSVTPLNSDTLLVSNFLSHNVLLVRLSDGAIAGSFPVGLAPEGIIVNGDYVFVCCSGYDQAGYHAGTVHIMDRATLMPVDTLFVGVNPQFAAVDNSRRLHVVCTGDYSDAAGEIHIFNLADLVRDTVLAIGGTPSRISLSDEYAFVAAGGWVGSGLVFRYRLNGLSVINGSENPIYTSAGAYDVAALFDGSFLVSCSYSDVVELRNGNGGLTRSYLVSSNPGYMALYSANTSQNIPIINNKSHNTISAYPNPFNAVINFRWSSRMLNDEYINIYNSIGQLVQQLEIPSGTDKLIWNSENRIGNSLPSGTYYAVCPGSINRATLRITLIK